MVNIEYSAEDCKSSKINIGRIMRNSKMLKFVPVHPKTKKMCKHAVKKLPFIIRFFPDQYRTQQICYKAILENGVTLESYPDCYKNH